MASNPFEPPQEVDRNEQPLPLHRRHVAVLGLATIALFVWNHRQYSMQLAGVDVAERYVFLSALWDSVYGATMLMGAVALFDARATSGRLLRHPGHWLVMTEAMLVVAGILAASLSLYPLVPLALLALFALAAVAHRRFWRWCFVALAVAPFLESRVPAIEAFLFSRLAPPTPVGEPLPTNTLGVFSLLVGMIRAIPPLMVVVLAFREQSGGQSRDWVHWLGVASCAMRLVILGQGVFGSLLIR